MKSFIISNLNSIFKPRGYIFFGWWIVVISSLIQFLGNLLWVQAYGVYAVIFQSEFGWSMTIISGAFALIKIVSGLLGPLQGWLVDKYGPRLILTFGLVIFGLGFLILSQIQTLLSFYIIIFVMSLGLSLGGHQTFMVSIVHWFNQHRAKAVALAQSGPAVCGLCVPIIAFGIEYQGWRFMSFISGLILIFLGIPLVQWVKHKPEDIEEKVDGVFNFSKNSVVTSNEKIENFLTLNESLKTSAFWLISLGHAISLLSVSAVVVHLIPHLTLVLGLGLTTASIIYSTVGIFQLLGLLVGGYLGDRFDKRWICIFCMFSNGMGILLLAYAEELSIIFLFCILHGLAFGIRIPQIVSLRAEYFGIKSYGKILGFSSLIVMFGFLGGPMICGLLFDLYGNYSTAFFVIGIITILGGLCFILTKEPDGII